MTEYLKIVLNSRLLTSAFKMFAKIGVIWHYGLLRVLLLIYYISLSKPLQMTTVYGNIIFLNSLFIWFLLVVTWRYVFGIFLCCPVLQGSLNTTYFSNFTLSTHYLQTERCPWLFTS